MFQHYIFITGFDHVCRPRSHSAHAAPGFLCGNWRGTQGPRAERGGKQSNVSQNSSTRDAHAPRAHKSKRYMTSNVSSVGIPASSTSSSRLVSARSAGSLRPVGTEKRRKTKDLGTWDRVLVCNGVNVYTSSHKGCDPWRLGVPRTSTHLGTKHHLFVAGCPGWTTPHDL